MRAGCFAETRVIELLNRRFVPFFFNRGGPGEGHDPEALAFVDGQTRNPWAYLAAFTPDGKILGETEVYADKDDVFEFLAKLLEEHPEYAGATEEETLCLAATEADATRDERLRAAELLEELGRYDEAIAQYRHIVEQDPGRAPTPAALLGLLRISRYQRDWEQHAEYEDVLAQVLSEEEMGALGPDIVVERGHRLLGQKKFAAAREQLQDATRRAKDSPRLAELHFYAGVACWFLEDRDWAKFHWCWILDNRPEDRMYSRARVAAAAEAMPYANPELGGYEAPVGNIGPHNIVMGVDAAMSVYRQMKPSYERGELSAEKPDPLSGLDADDPEALVLQLRDGNAHVADNNPKVDRLVGIGLPSLDPLMEAIADADFEGRGYAAWALAQVLAELDPRPGEAMAVLEACTKDDDPYVRLLSSSGQRYMAKHDEEHGEARDTTGKSPFLLVAELRDGNEHRIANNRIVDQLEIIGEPAVPSLVAAIGDDAFPGRGYAAWGLSQVLKATDSRAGEAMAALHEAAKDEDPYVRTLSRSGLGTLGER